MWQDWAIFVVQWGFIIANLPTVFDRTQKPAILTSVGSALGLYVVTAVYVDLELWASSLSSFILGSEWALLGYQRWQLDKKKTG